MAECGRRLTGKTATEKDKKDRFFRREKFVLTGIWSIMPELNYNNNQKDKDSLYIIYIGNNEDFIGQLK